MDEQILRDAASRQQLAVLVKLRHRVSELRRLLSVHRRVYQGLAAPGFRVFEGDEPEALLQRLFERYEHTLEAVGSVRELLLGSFDLYMTSTSQRTNDTMRVLTVVTVTLGIVAAVAGVLGVNFQGVDVFRLGNRGFHDMLITIGLLVGVVLLIGRWLKWL
ncbi:CorA family divalent cation transporter [Deinococcus sonorensis]|uniref:CorA family divalent cation transporter n=2 Tax=Deinococcus sonorensis TaxID=309891 RepID=A0AAU7U5K8_9DEIO